MEYHGVLPNISLSRMSFDIFIAFGLEGEHTTLLRAYFRINVVSKRWFTTPKNVRLQNKINNSDLDGMSLASFCQSRVVQSSLSCIQFGLEGEHTSVESIVMEVFFLTELRESSTYVQSKDN